ncbi:MULTISPECIES: P1 family peptidase [Streptomyces]|uniref:P1 family peptidase n=1 Tax=Streptomyces glycanivorans TaxID=3033808 RepID=A0ABY9J398_9ACTN|nr:MULTISPECIES: P1 family peptidase [unclassified Streptomyces]TXS12804.1 peptidase S58 family protein [Streptomyces sp. wa22]WLQ62153.1 P1 family peptidase [Streptomyces sp. Alt3]WSR04589.1 P1 family peptidase [Streptomyces sp. NBC_01208]WSR52761.1 P1 family peptidase [Streptomyces sp. NBC_01201]
MSGMRTPGPAPRTGPRNALTDVAGIRVGHSARTGGGWLTGVTAVLAPEDGMAAAVDVRGGGPGTRETDALDPRNLVARIDAVVLTGGSAFGLDAASGVAAWLEERGRGFRVGAGPAQVVPVVPAAALFDLGRGGLWTARPGAELGREAVEEAFGSEEGGAVLQGCAGAGTGAVAGGMKGGIGTASIVLPSGTTVAALVAVNASGSLVDPSTGALYGAWTEVGDEFRARGMHAPFPDAAVHAGATERLASAREESRRRQTDDVRQLNTTLAVVATDAALTRPQAQKLAGTAHDGLARAIRPVHLLTDGDTVFALSTGRLPLSGGEADGTEGRTGWRAHTEVAAVNEILAAGADVVSRAVVHAALAARTTDTPGGLFPSYPDLYGTTEKGTSLG